MTDQTRNLLISLASHMAYMQGQLEAFTQQSDPEDYYWYRESVALRQKVTDALADGPAVPEGREPASVVSEPSDEELLELMPETMRDEFAYAATTCSDATGGQVKPRIFRVCLNTAALEYARAVLARWGYQPAPPAEGEVGELVAELRMMASQAAEACQFTDAESLSSAADLLEQRHPAPVPQGEVAELVAWLRMQGEAQKPGPNSLLSGRTKNEQHAAGMKLTRAAELLQRHPAPVPVAERLPGPEDCDAEGRCWLHFPDMGTEPLWRLTDPSLRSRYHSHWLPATALPQGEVE